MGDYWFLRCQEIYYMGKCVPTQFGVMDSLQFSNKITTPLTSWPHWETGLLVRNFSCRGEIQSRTYIDGWTNLLCPLTTITLPCQLCGEGPYSPQPISDYIVSDSIHYSTVALCIHLSRLPIAKYRKYRTHAIVASSFISPTSSHKFQGIVQ